MTTKNKQAKHSPTPWRITTTHRVIDAEGRDIGSARHGNPEELANAHHTVRCVNAHDDLVASLDEVLRHMSLFARETDDITQSVTQRARAALKKAGEL